jgi:hypothetical protein
MGVVNDLLAYVDRGTILLQSLLDRYHGSIDSGAVAPWLGNEDSAGSGGLGLHTFYATWSGLLARACVDARDLPD